MHDFAYHAPTGLDEDLALLAANPDARLLAGGTDLFLALEHGATAGIPSAVVDLKRIPELSRIEAVSESGVRLGALVRMATLERDARIRQYFPALAAGASFVGGPAIRNRATLGGNVCNASPAADASPPLLALKAQAVLRSAQGERRMPLADLWRGPRQIRLRPGELLFALELPIPPPRSGNAFTRLTRSAMDIAVVNAAAAVTLDDKGQLTALRVALGAVGPTVLNVSGLEPLLGYKVDSSLLDSVRESAENSAQPIDDLRASAPYRREMAGVLARRAVEQAARLASASFSGVANASGSAA